MKKGFLMEWSESKRLYVGKWTTAVFLLILAVLTTRLTYGQSSEDEYQLYMPLLASPLISCDIPGQSYGKMLVNGPPISPPAEENPDTNLGVCGYAPTTAELELVVLGPVADPKAPQFPALFTDNRVPLFSNAYHRYRNVWGVGCTNDTYSPWDTTLLGMAVAPGEIIQVPDSGYDIGGGYEVMVLYAAENRITFHVGNSDKLDGYVIHVEDVCTEPDLLALYESLNAAGRQELPVLYGRQPFGRALGNEIKVAIRDSGHFLDPRSRNSWWQGR